MPAAPPRPTTPSPNSPTTNDAPSPPIGPSTPPAKSSLSPKLSSASESFQSTGNIQSSTMPGDNGASDTTPAGTSSVSQGSSSPSTTSAVTTNGVNGIIHTREARNGLVGSNVGSIEGQSTPNGVVNGETTGISSSGEHVDSSHSDADGEWSSDDWMQDMRRVKVYELIGSRWTDRGTALCTGIYDDELDQAAIVARSEVTDVELLRSEIRVTDVYQRQQETLIVWTEPDGTDYALSFQDLEGCAEIWDFIMEVQRHFRGKIGVAGSSSSPLRDNRNVSANSIISAGRLPEPTLGIISEIDKAIKFIGRTASGKEKICEYIVHEDYIKGLVDVMSQAEDLEALGDLHALCNLMQTILMMNDHGIYDYILQDEIYTGIIGMLEYDPDFPTYKASFRDFLRESTQYKEVVHFKDETIRKKIHQTYRLQYLKDVVLARVLDDPTFNVLNSFILFNQIDIINHIQHDESILRDIFGPFKDSCLVLEANGEGKGKEKEPPIGPNGEATSLSSGPSGQPPTIRKEDVVLFIHQLCMMGKNIQIPARLALYRTLVDRGLLFAVQWALQQSSDQQMLNAAGEILLIVVDHDVMGLRAHILKQADPTGDDLKHNDMERDPRMEGMQEPDQQKKKARTGTTLLTVMIKVLSTAKALALRGQMSDSLRSILEVPNGDDSAINKLARLREDSSTERFLQYFYDNCANSLYQPLTDLPETKGNTVQVYPISRDQSSICLYLCDILCNFVQQHSHRSQYFVLSSSICAKVATLLRAREKHLRLAALRFFRICIKMNNNFLLRHLIKQEMFSPILQLTISESKRDNLINSSCQEFFEHIRRENVRMVINHLMDKHVEEMRRLSQLPSIGERFQGLIRRWEMNNEPPPKKMELITEVEKTGNRWNRGGPDTEEEEYFNESDEDDHPRMASVGVKRKRGGRGGSVMGNRPSRPVTAGVMALPSPYPMKLVDYADEDDEATLPDSPTVESPNTLLSPSPLPLESTGQPGQQGGLKRTKSETSLSANGSVNGAKSTSESTQVQSKKRLSPAEALSPPESSSESSPKLGFPGAQKRRRDDDDDEMFGLLAAKTKRQTAGSADKSKAESDLVKPVSDGKEALSSSTNSATTKKIKLSLGKTGFGIASSILPSPPAIVSDGQGKQEGDGG